MSWKKSTAAAHEVGLFDAHCHPTDIMSEIGQIATMKAKALTIMATRAQDQGFVADVGKQFPVESKEDLLNEDGNETKAQGRVIPSFGWHPWFSHQLYVDRNSAGDDNGKSNSTSPIDHNKHYSSVLTPSPADDTDFLASLPAPTSLTKYLRETEQRLRTFPLALVGEVGLDRSFRVPAGVKKDATSRSAKSGSSSGEYTGGSREGRPLSPYHVAMGHQKAVLKAQLQLAGKCRRAVSVHSVATHGLVFDVLQELWEGHERPSKAALKRLKKDALNALEEDSEDGGADLFSSSTKEVELPYPPRICMHSYSGPSDALKQFLSPRVPAEIFFSFSECINFSPPASKKVVEVIKMVPDDKILIESDLHCAGKTMDGLLEKILVRVCDIKGWDLEEGAERLRDNWMRFVFGS